jgi:hypothetical protein
VTPTHLTLLDEAIETLGAAIDMSASLSTVDDVAGRACRDGAGEAGVVSARMKEAVA